jgi:3-oxoacyl-[acyl-carrier protein] reductase
MKLLSGRVALVTGSSRGIGAAIARLFAAHGAKVALHGRDTTALSAIRGEIEKNGGVATQAVSRRSVPRRWPAMRRNKNKFS